MTKDWTKLREYVGKTVSSYIITRYISSGSFGDVFEAKHKTSNKLVALKIPVKTEEKDGEESIIEESKIYKSLSNPERGIANMKIIKHDDKKIIVMDLLGSSLEKLLETHKKFGLKTIIHLAIEMIDTVKYIHKCGYIHRDIKPDNFVLGYDDPKKLYLIDFGLAKMYIDKYGNHNEYKNIKKFCGTARYASISAHRYREQSRKDDLESIGYILIYLYKGKLPWQGIKEKDKKTRYKLIGKMKREITEEQLCKNMPKEFLVFLKYVRNLDFDEKPHYTSLINMFKKLYMSRNYTDDLLEWEKN